jgi:hypothetical protein
MRQQWEAVRPDRFVVWLTIVAALLVVVGLASVLVLQRQPAPAPDLTTPDGTVLAYIQVYRTGTDSELESFYSRRLTDQLVNQAPPGAPKPFSPRQVQAGESQRFQIVSTRLDGERATVTVGITKFRADSPVSPSEYTYQTAVPLVREDGRWKLDQEWYFG